jgi:hypothetical protein
MQDYKRCPILVPKRPGNRNVGSAETEPEQVDAAEWQQAICRESVTSCTPPTPRCPKPSSGAPSRTSCCTATGALQHGVTAPEHLVPVRCQNSCRALDLGFYYRHSCSSSSFPC